MESTMEQRLQDFLLAEVRDGFPYMKTSRTHLIAKRCNKLLGNEIEAQMPEMVDTKSRISFLSLSAELRNHIDALVLSPEQEGEAGVPGSTGICVDGHRQNDDCDITYYGEVTDWAKQPSLTRVSHHIRLESLPVSYGNNRFIVYSDGWDVEEDDYARRVCHTKAMCWLKAIGSHNTALLKDIHVRFREYNDLDWCPAKRFIGIAQRRGIKLPPARIKGFVSGWSGYEETPVLRGRLSIDETVIVTTHVWREVDESQVVYQEKYDVVGGYEWEPKPVFLKNSWERLVLVQMPDGNRY
ncbi:hypothetical protein LTR37_011161 [Vermiconidia calcicola]|uniref:Uncharacterized protein n=1 Tax=Vermiconidia calcicola TaxID=1690605 RepID=A0ACC3N4K4_9PEZI|nr:hypothetical protein LTR37_011161 [Vermiconidia calcicola]